MILNFKGVGNSFTSVAYSVAWYLEIAELRCQASKVKEAPPLKASIYIVKGAPPLKSINLRSKGGPHTLKTRKCEIKLQVVSEQRTDA